MNLCLVYGNTKFLFELKYYLSVDSKTKWYENVYIYSIIQCLPYDTLSVPSLQEVLIDM